MLEIRNLTAGYPGRPVLNYVNLNVPEGKVTVIAGPNGCGKSTLLKAVAGILPGKGQLLLNDEPLHSLPPRLLARKIAYLPQSRPVPEITAERLVLHGRFPWLGYPRRYRQEDLTLVREIMEKLDIAHLAACSVASLSGGQRQKVYLAMALAQDTPVVLLDEPDAFLDIRHRLRLMELAKDLAREGKTVVTVLHDLAMALEGADQLAVMKDGAVAAQGTPEEIYGAGCLKDIFGVDVCRMHTPDGWKYYYK